MLVHGTAVALGPHGVLIRGPSGSGKSDLALRLLATPREGYPALASPPLGSLALVSDDQVELKSQDASIVMSAPSTIRGKLEVRGLGIVTLPTNQHVMLSLVVDIVPSTAIERVPDPAVASVIGIDVPRMEVAAFEASAPLKILLALHHRIER